MNYSDKILEQLHYFNINSEIDSVFDNWVVTKKGDVVNTVFPYAIFSIHFYEENWIEKLRTKIWFNPECEKSLSHALNRANEILKELIVK